MPEERLQFSSQNMPQQFGQNVCHTLTEKGHSTGRNLKHKILELFLLAIRRIRNH